MLTNYTFAVGMSDYLNAPSDSKKVKVMGEVSSFLKDLETGENLIHSTYIYTDRWEFDNFVRLRNWDFRFKEEPFYQAFEDHPGISMRWFPVEKDQIFKGGDEVIPYVRKFSVLDYEMCIRDSCIGGFSSLAWASTFCSSGLEMKNTSALDKPWANASSWEP